MATQTAGMDATDALPFFPPERRPQDPPVEFARYQANDSLTPVRLYDGRRAWLATRFEDVRNILGDPRLSANPTSPGFPNISDGRASLVANEELSFTSIDAPDHGRLRRIFQPEFTLQRVAAMREKIVGLVNGLIDEMLAGPNPVDFVDAVALPMPSRLMADLLGVPVADRPMFEELSARKTDFSLPPEELLQVGEDFVSYIRKLVAEKRKNLDTSDDIITRMLRDHEAHGHMSESEAIAAIRLLIIAGHETTAHSSSLGLLLLLQHPEHFERLRQTTDPAVIRTVVEEILRHTSVVQLMSARVAMEDIEYKGHHIAKGEGIVTSLPQANRDPSRFENPDEFQPFRKLTSPHVTFGFGVHQCLGQPLARLEMEVLFDILPKRVPTLRLAASLPEIEFKGNSLTYGVNALPVTW